MKKMFYFIPAIIVSLFYLSIGILDSFHVILPMAYVGTIMLFVSGLLMNQKRWYGCLLGVIFGCVLIGMSTVDTGQIINIELPAGIAICIYYLFCGYHIFQKGV